MMKRVLSFLLLLLAGLPLQAAIGDWQIYMAYYNATKVAPAGPLIYTLSEGSLYSYDTAYTSVRTYDRLNLLSDVKIKDIAYSEAYTTLLIVYANSNIDLLVADEEVYNFPELKDKTMLEDKTINNITLDGRFAYLSTNFGILVFDLRKREISNTYNLGLAVKNCVVHNQAVYAATDKGILCGRLADNLLDKQNWTLSHPEVFTNLVLFGGKLVGQTDEGLVAGSFTAGSFAPLFSHPVDYLSVGEGCLLAGTETQTALFHEDLGRPLLLETDLVKYMTRADDLYWTARGMEGLNAYRLNTGSGALERVVGPVIPNSPRLNSDFYMTYTDRLLIAAGGVWASRFFNPGYVMQLRDGQWSAFGTSSDITKVVQDPYDAEHLFACTAGYGLYEFKDQALVRSYGVADSGLESVYPGGEEQDSYVLVNSVTYDGNHNLWMTNAFVKNTIKVLKNNGEWVSLYYKNFSEVPTPGDLLFDSRGRVWCASRRGANRTGLFCLDYNGTLEDTSDDRAVFHSMFVDQNGERIVPLAIYTVQEDLDGTLWVGTDKGPLLFSQPERYFESNACTRVIVPRNDGTNLGDYLLENEQVKVICCDGDNRKWIGTGNSGIYLISADGLETVQHFTTENSPLISNAIESIALNPHNGEVYIGTDQGLVSYRSDATRGATAFHDSEVYAYPNPVPPHHEGPVVVKGLMRNSRVKVVDVSGKLVHAGNSTGGQFVWNGCGRNGQRVPSGIYLVLAADENGKEGVVTKITFIR